MKDAGANRGGGGVRALHRSFDVYYRDTARTARMDALNRAFVGPDALVFDLGAHLGDRVGSFLRLGARVVALEPQRLPYRALRFLYGRCDRAVLLPMAVGATSGSTNLITNSRNPTVATLAPGFVAAAKDAPGWEGQVWDGRARVEVTTLDALVAQYGVPDFVKIDVEGHEAEVLAGLSVAPPALSFEVTTIQPDVARACLDRIEEVGRYEFNLSLGEAHRLEFTDWMGASAMRAHLAALPPEANSGDVYARRV